MPLEHRSDTIRMIRSHKATRVPLHLSVNRFNDFRSAIEFGAVSDLKPPDETVEIGEDFRFLTRSRGWLPTADECFFWSAVNAGEQGKREEAADHWLSCIEAGQMKGHFGLGYTLCELDRPREGYAHLRFYTEIAPRNPWAWAWRGVACEGMGEPAEARRCYRRAMRLRLDSGFQTFAEERLAQLDARP